MDAQSLLKTATTDSLYALLADTLTVLRTRGEVTLTDGRVDTEHATVGLDEDGFTFIHVYYGEANAETAMEQRDPPLYTLDDVAARLKLPASELKAFIDAEAAGMVAEGVAHFEGGNLIIDGGA